MSFSFTCDEIRSDGIEIHQIVTDLEWLHFTNEMDDDKMRSSLPMCGWFSAEPSGDMIKSEIQRFLQSGVDAPLFAAFANNTLVGFVYGDLHTDTQPHRAEIQMLCAKRCQRKGIGSALLIQFENYCIEKSAESGVNIVLSSDRSADQFYLKHNYQVDEEREKKKRINPTISQVRLLVKKIR